MSRSQKCQSQSKPRICLVRALKSALVPHKEYLGSRLFPPSICVLADHFNHIHHRRSKNLGLWNLLIYNSE